MREFKFRAWDKVEKRMFTVMSWSHPLYLDQIIEVTGQSSDHVHAHCYEDCILMQYLGWKNRYNQELWEGDVLESDGGVRRTIIYDPDKHWGWCFDTGAEIYHAYHWKVVGHAYEDNN